jgi:hypothetical protein
MVTGVEIYKETSASMGKVRGVDGARGQASADETIRDAGSYVRASIGRACDWPKAS